MAGAATPKANGAADRQLKVRLETVRAVVIVAHNAAGFLWAEGDAQCARLLRTSEALARQALALLAVPQTQRASGAKAVQSTSGAKLGKATAGGSGAEPGQGGSRSARRRRRRRAAAEASGKDQKLGMTESAGGEQVLELADGNVVMGDLSELLNGAEASVGAGPASPGTGVGPPFPRASSASSAPSECGSGEAMNLQEVWERAVKKGPGAARLCEQVFLSKGIGKGGVGLREPGQRRRDK